MYRQKPYNGCGFSLWPLWTSWFQIQCLSCGQPVFHSALLLQDPHEYAGEILLLSGLTDLADGYIARRFHRISNLGKILDPVADKLTQAAMLICLFTRFPHVLLLIVIMAGKELYMVVSGCLVIRKTGKVHGADWHGKIVTFLLYGTAAVHIIWFHITPMVSDLLIGLCAIMMVISVALYIIQNTRTLKGETV